MNVNLSPPMQIRITNTLVQMTITSDFVEIVGKVESANVIDPHNWFELKVDDRMLY
jgi:hypothetical protein